MMMNSTFFHEILKKILQGEMHIVSEEYSGSNAKIFSTFTLNFFSAFLEEVRTNFLSLLIFIIRCPCGTCEEKRFCRTAKIEK